MPAITLAVADRFPIAGLVTSAFIRLRISETLRQQRTIAKTLLPLFGQRAQGRPHAWRSEIGGLTLVGQHQEAAILHDQLQSCDQR